MSESKFSTSSIGLDVGIFTHTNLKGTNISMTQRIFFAVNQFVTTWEIKSIGFLLLGKRLFIISSLQYEPSNLNYVFWMN